MNQNRIPGWCFYFSILKHMNEWMASQLPAYLWARAHRCSIVLHWPVHRCSSLRAWPWHSVPWGHSTSTCSLTPKCHPAGHSWPFAPRDTCNCVGEENENQKSNAKIATTSCIQNASSEGTLTKRRTADFRWHVLVCIPAAVSIPRLYANQALPEFLLRPLQKNGKERSIPINDV